MANRPKFREGDVVMICKHLYEAATRGEMIAWRAVAWEGPFDPPQGFTREDGSTGRAHYGVECSACFKSSEPTDYIEEVYRNGQLHVADFQCKAHGGH
jgi:hypothetical protein